MKPADIPRMRRFARRRLTAGEAELAGGIFADSLDCGRVQVLQAPAAGAYAFVPFGGTVVFCRWRAALDFAEAGLHEQGWFIHELAHVWQAQRGVKLALAKLRAMGLGAYRVPWEQPFAAMNIEAQAEVARLTFLARSGAKVDAPPHTLETLWLEALWPIRGAA